MSPSFVNGPGFPYDTITTDTKLYGTTKRHALVSKIQLVLFVLTMRRYPEGIPSDSPGESKKCD